MTERLPTFCGKDCGGNACPLLAIVRDGRVERLERNPAGGPDRKPCPRGYALHNSHYAPERLLSPLLTDGPRGSGRYREASWDEALDLVARRLGGIRTRHGPASVLNLCSAGSTGALHDCQNLATRFLNAAGGATSLSSNYSNGAAKFVLPYLFGSAVKNSGWDASTVRYSKLVVLWGANVLETRLGIDLGTVIADAARSGVPVIVLDPRLTRTAQAIPGARWIPIRPGTDAAMMLAVLHTLIADGSVDMQRAAKLAVGLEELCGYVSGDADGVEKSAAWAAPITGIPAAVTVSFARQYAAARPAMIVPGYSIQRVRNGEETFRLSVALQIATGNFGVRGGSTGSLNNRLPTPVLGSLSDLAGLQGSAMPAVPVLRWPDAILEGRAGGYPSDIAAAYVTGFNAVNQGGDSPKSIRAMHKLEFSVCHEMFMTPTARLCDVVLPVASPLEKQDIGIPWAGNYLVYKDAVTAPLGQAKSDYAIFGELSERMGFPGVFTEGRTPAEWIDSFIADSEIADPALFKSTGVYVGVEHGRVGLSGFAAAPELHPLPTPSGKVELRSEAYARDTGRHAIPVWTDPPSDPRYPFLLVTPKTIHRTHSQDGGPAPWAKARVAGDGAPVKRRPDHGELSVCRADAASLGLVDGDLAIVSNERGATIAVVAVTNDIAPGVACLHQGVWLDIGEDGIDRSGSANMLTSTDGSGPAVAPVMHALAVAISKHSSGPTPATGASLEYGAHPVTPP
jgi:anaerobic dimethyl sulfoxide reductase subunit A